MSGEGDVGVTEQSSAVPEGEVGAEGGVTGLKIDEEMEAKTGTYNNYVEVIRSRIKGINSMEKPNFPKKLFDSLSEIIWDVELLGAEESYMKRILSQLDLQFSFETAKNEIGVQPSDIQDLLEHKPTEVIGDKCCQIVLLLCQGELDRSIKELHELKRFLSHPAILRNVESEVGYRFAAKTLELFVNKTGGVSDKLIIFGDSDDEGSGTSEIPAFEDLPTKSQVAVMVIKCFVTRNYRHRIVDRIDLLKEVIILDSCNYEWYITRAEMWRRKRRDSLYSRGKRPVVEEFELVGDAYQMAQENPFVRLCLMDCIIDCIRDSRGQFKCGKVKFDTADETMQFMKDSCRDLLKQFPNSIRINSQISDYFCRFVSFRYFDVDFAEECLQRAYNLNPKNPKTTHRLGIFTRMSKGDIPTSFEWFKTTVELDPLHYNAFMECVKNMMAKLDENDVIKYMNDKLKTQEAASWTETEILELLFYKGLVHFAKNDIEKVLDTWEIVCNGNQLIFRLTDLDRTLGFYEWDENLISTDKLRLWINGLQTNLNLTQKESAGDSSGPKVDESRKTLVNLLYSLMIGGASPARPPKPSGIYNRGTLLNTLNLSTISQE